jgi:hypothetical protein
MTGLITEEMVVIVAVAVNVNLDVAAVVDALHNSHILI